jgi:hypothetical protein
MIRDATIPVAVLDMKALSHSILYSVARRKDSPDKKKARIIRNKYDFLRLMLLHLRNASPSSFPLTFLKD